MLDTKKYSDVVDELRKSYDSAIHEEQNSYSEHESIEAKGKAQGLREGMDVIMRLKRDIESHLSIMDTHKKEMHDEQYGANCIDKIVGPIKVPLKDGKWYEHYLIYREGKPTFSMFESEIKHYFGKTLEDLNGKLRKYSE